MIVIVCLDDGNGMMFNGRRQSRDRAVIEDVALLSKDSKLYVKEYSYKLFSDLNLQNVVVSSDMLNEAEDGEYCFVEDMSVGTFSEKIERLIIYKWNRVYPADFYFDMPVDKGWQLSEIKEFVGTSHEKITKEIYINAQT